MTKFDAAANEHDAWIKVVQEWDKTICESMNNPAFNDLVDAIQSWGQSFGILRIEQDREGRST